MPRDARELFRDASDLPEHERATLAHRLFESVAPPSDPLTNPTEAFGPLEEKTYKAELDLFERYQVFFGQLLRLSLAGIGVFGFLYEHILGGLNISDYTSDAATKIVMAQKLAAASVIILSLCAACALLFRYFATEGARYYI